MRPSHGLHGCAACAEQQALTQQHTPTTYEYRCLYLARYGRLLLLPAVCVWSYARAHGQAHPRWPRWPRQRQHPAPRPAHGAFCAAWCFSPNLNGWLQLELTAAPRRQAENTFKNQSHFQEPFSCAAARGARRAAPAPCGACWKGSASWHISTWASPALSPQRC